LPVSTVLQLKHRSPCWWYSPSATTQERSDLDLSQVWDDRRPAVLPAAPSGQRFPFFDGAALMFQLLEPPYRDSAKSIEEMRRAGDRPT
jgi:hypothetical protein